MLTLFHSPLSRSTRIVTLIEEMGIDCDIRIVTISRQDGSGGPDPKNPHPEGKVPLLMHDGTLIRETAAIMLYLTELFPQSGMGVPPGAPDRGAFLSWMVWYGSVMEPVMVFEAAGLDHPYLEVTFRGMPELTARLAEGLADRPYLMGAHYTAADLLLASPFQWFPETLANTPPVIRDWVARCSDRPAMLRAAALDQEAMA